MTENTWVTDNIGVRTFRHGGWTITVFPNNPKPMLTEPDADVEVCVTEEGIQCWGERSIGYGYEGVRFTIPWRILQELCAIRASG